MIKLSVIGLVLIIISFVSGQDKLSCFEYKCPDSTLTCKQIREISADNPKLLNVLVSCFNRLGEVLDTSNYSLPNPFPTGVYYKGTRFRVAYSSNPKNETAENNRVYLKKLSDDWPKHIDGPDSDAELI